MRREEVEEVYAIARQVLKEEITKVIESLRKELEPPAWPANKPDLDFIPKKEGKKDTI